MLVLGRKLNETIVMTTAQGERIVVELLQLRADRIRLGIQAPEEVKILRGEMALREEEEVV